MSWHCPVPAKKQPHCTYCNPCAFKRKQRVRGKHRRSQVALTAILLELIIMEQEMLPNK